MLLEFSERSAAPDIVVFSLKGRLSSGNRLGDAEFAAKKIIGAGNKKLLIDITGVDYLDSAALGMLIFITGEISRGGGTAYVAGANQRVSDIFKICHAETVLHLHPSVESALQAFGAA
jgi:anti-sigma B factor antagonist